MVHLEFLDFVQECQSYRNTNTIAPHNGMRADSFRSGVCGKWGVGVSLLSYCFQRNRKFPVGSTVASEFSSAKRLRDRVPDSCFGIKRGQHV